MENIKDLATTTVQSNAVIDKIFVKMLKSAVRDYIFDRNIKETKEFFVSDWFNQIMEHFSSSPEEFRHAIFYYKSYYLKKKKLKLQIDKGILILNL